MFVAVVRTISRFLAVDLLWPANDACKHWQDVWEVGGTRCASVINYSSFTSCYLCLKKFLICIWRYNLNSFAVVCDGSWCSSWSLVLYCIVLLMGQCLVLVRICSFSHVLPLETEVGLSQFSLWVEVLCQWIFDVTAVMMISDQVRGKVRKRSESVYVWNI